MDSLGYDEKVLSYGDVVLRSSDLKILRGPYFLNDRIIEFYFCYLTSSLNSSKIMLVGPSISFWILNAPDIDSLQEFVDPLKLPDKEMVIFPINNNDDVNMAEGGSHWSLLAYHRKKNVFEHYDSSSGSNSFHAKKFVAKIKDFMGSSATSARIVQHFTPQQENSYDCGMYVLATAKELCSFHGNEAKTSGEEWAAVLNRQVTPYNVSEMKNCILEIIKHLSDNK